MGRDPTRWLAGHNRRNSLERTLVLLKSKGLPPFCVKGAWNVRNTMTFVGCV